MTGRYRLLITMLGISSLVIGSGCHMLEPWDEEGQHIAEYAREAPRKAPPKESANWGDDDGDEPEKTSKEDVRPRASTTSKNSSSNSKSSSSGSTSKSSSSSSSKSKPSSNDDDDAGIHEDKSRDKY